MLNDSEDKTIHLTVKYKKREIHQKHNFGGFPLLTRYIIKDFREYKAIFFSLSVDHNDF